MINFLKATGLDHIIIDSLYAFDFAATTDFAFIHTIGGAHLGDAWRRTGYCGLGRAVKQLGLTTWVDVDRCSLTVVRELTLLPSNEELRIDFITSSVGSLDIDFLARIYRACQGDDGLTEYTIKNATTKKASNGTREKFVKSVERCFRIYFPTHETVTSSTAGSAGTICIQSKYYDNPKFPRQLMRDCRSIRSGVLMHNKVRCPGWCHISFQGHIVRDVDRCSGIVALRAAKRKR